MPGEVVVVAGAAAAVLADEGTVVTRADGCSAPRHHRRDRDFAFAVAFAAAFVFGSARSTLDKNRFVMEKCSILSGEFGYAVLHGMLEPNTIMKKCAAAAAATSSRQMCAYI